METVYLHIPELPRTRHIIAGDRHIINTAAPDANVIHKVRRRADERIKQEQTEKLRAPQ